MSYCITLHIICHRASTNDGNCKYIYKFLTPKVHQGLQEESEYVKMRLLFLKLDAQFWS